MTSPSDMPPGVSPSDIPGNIHTNLEWDNFFELVSADASENGMTPLHALMVWKVGVVVYMLLNEFKGHGAPAFVEGRAPERESDEPEN